MSWWPVLLCFLACRQMPPDGAATRPSSSAATVVKVYAWWDLPKEDPRSHELSGIAWEPARKVLYAIPDKTPQIVELIPDPTFHKWRFGASVQVHIPGAWDGEGLAVTERGFLLSSEKGPRVYEVGRSGEWLETLPLPEHFRRSRTNLALEALSLTEDGRYFFTANEQALAGDGPCATRQQGTLVRILRHDRGTGAQAEFAYRTDPLYFGSGEGELGVVDLAALSPRDLLVMERGYLPGTGNSARIYRVRMDGIPDTLATDHLNQNTEVLNKTLFVDLRDLPDSSFPSALPPQPSRILANFEGMALGPRVEPGRRLLFLISDDNSSAGQLARLLVLIAPDLDLLP